MDRGRMVDLFRSEDRIRVRAPRVALVVGNMNKDPIFLMLLTVIRSLTELGYTFMVYALHEGEAYSAWQNIGCQVQIWQPESPIAIDWSNYEGVILSSLEAKSIITSFMEHPFDSIPLVWLIHEDILAKRLSYYESSGWEHLIAAWKTAFSRSNVMVFPDYSLPMMYATLDTGNYYVIPGSPANYLEAESYIASHSRNQLRKYKGFDDDDFIILVTGGHLFFDEIPREYTAIMKVLIPEIKKITKMEELGGIFKFVFLCGDSTTAHDASFQELASQMGFPVEFVKHYGVDGDLNSVLLMADLVLYGSFQTIQNFPPLLIKAMSFKIPIIAPNLEIITKYVVDKVHGLIFNQHDLSTLVKAFFLLIEDRNLSNLGYTIASSGKTLSKNMLALDCISDYAKLLEKVLHFPSDVVLPLSVSHIEQNTWAWELLDYENKQTTVQHAIKRQNIIDLMENEIAKPQDQNTTQTINESLLQNFPSQLDWDIVGEMNVLEDSELREKEEIEDRMPRNLGEWDAVYNAARKIDKNTKFETNERDEAQLERIGLELCIYEIYSGRASWPFLRHGSLYRGISTTKRAQRPRSDDVDAVNRLPILNDPYYRDILCEFGAMFSIANKVDTIHNMPWIGFQSWHAAGKKLSLSEHAEEVLEQTTREKSDGDVIYYWASLNVDQINEEENEAIDFWSMCDILNAGNCKNIFEETFKLMYGIPKEMKALPPMPDDGYQWSALHSWVMPTPSFLEFIMFSRMFVDSMDNLNQKNNSSCILGSSDIEKKHCYCRVLEVLVNIWAYHSARKMVYVDPINGKMTEQHPIDKRTGQMWVKYFDPALLKSMDEDLAEESDDGMYQFDNWLWPLTGEVHWPGIFDKEREDKYRRKMNKKRINKEKLLDRQKFGYKQKSLG